jgi:hypothetical protein
MTPSKTRNTMKLVTAKHQSNQFLTFHPSIHLLLAFTESGKAKPMPPRSNVPILSTGFAV